MDDKQEIRPLEVGDKVRVKDYSSVYYGVVVTLVRTDCRIGVNRVWVTDLDDEISFNESDLVRFDESEKLSEEETATEEYVREYNKLKAKREIIKRAMAKMKDERIRSLPYRVNDCVRIDHKRVWGDFGSQTIEKGWIAKIDIPDYEPDKINLIVYKTKKDGSQSTRTESFYGVKNNEVTILEHG